MNASGIDSEGRKFSNATEMWREEISAAAAGEDQGAAAVAGWYQKGIDYWKGVDASLDGVLGGYGHVNDADVKGSEAFLKPLLLERFGKAKRHLVALDCGSGIGRVTKNLLLKHFNESMADMERLLETSIEISMPDHAKSAKPRILLAASGSVAAIKFVNLCRSFSEWAEVRAVATKSALHFLDRSSFPKDVVLYTDDEEWCSWKKVGDEVLHIELRKWADVLVIAPLSANTLAKIAGGLCDNLLTCVVRAWDYSKPLFVAPAMNTFMWNNPFTERHLETITELGVSLIPPITKMLACGDYGNGAMAEPSEITRTLRFVLPKSGCC